MLSRIALFGKGPQGARFPSAAGPARVRAPEARRHLGSRRMIVSVVYPKTETSTFDLNYYTTKHMPLVQRLWGGHGMVSAQVLQGTGSLGGAPA